MVYVIETYTADRDAVGISQQRKTFLAYGRIWQFFADQSYYVAYRTSSDGGETWSDKTQVVYLGLNVEGSYFDVYFDGQYVHLVFAYNATTLKYKRGLVNGDGTITWGSESTVGSGVTFFEPIIVVDAGGFPWVGVVTWSYPDYACIITKSSRNDGVWETASGFPVTLSTAGDDIVVPVSFPNGYVVIFYLTPLGYLGYRIWNGQQLGLGQTTDIELAHDEWAEISFVRENLQVHIVYFKYEYISGDFYDFYVYHVVYNLSNNSFTEPVLIAHYYCDWVFPTLMRVTVEAQSAIVLTVSVNVNVSQGSYAIDYMLYQNGVWDEEPTSWLSGYATWRRMSQPEEWGAAQLWLAFQNGDRTFYCDFTDLELEPSQPPPPVNVEILFDSTPISMEDVIDVKVHLGCTKEVSSFELLLQNWDGKYSPGSPNALVPGVYGTIKLGRYTHKPQLITGRIEKLDFMSTADEHYLRVSGRCAGEALFRKPVSKSWFNAKGEDVVKDLLDSYVGLSHSRDGQELVEATDTTYAKLNYENESVFDILQYIAGSADKDGVIGFDFRVAPDGKFEFFQRMSKQGNVSLEEMIEEAEYTRDITRVRNKITVYGFPGATLPRDMDQWTEQTTSIWTAVSQNTTISLASSPSPQAGSYFIKIYRGACEPIFVEAECAVVDEDLNTVEARVSGKERLRMALRNISGIQLGVYITLLAPDASNYFVTHNAWLAHADDWALLDFPLGPEYEYSEANSSPETGIWDKVGNAEWKHIAKIRFKFSFPNSSEVWLGVDALHFTGQRFRAVAEDTESQQSYGLRELVEVDEELVSDDECVLRANALLDYLKSPGEHLTVRSSILDYGDTPILAGDKVYVYLPNELVDGFYRVISAEYHADARENLLETWLQLGREAPLLADYMYRLTRKTDSLSRLKASR